MLATVLALRKQEIRMQQTKYTKEQLEEARRLLGIESASKLNEALYNVHEFFSILR